MDKIKAGQLPPKLEEECKSGVKQNIERLLIASQSYDKAILGLSTATLGYTFIFAKFIMGNLYGGICLLILTWIFLFLSILLVVGSFILEQYHAEHRINYFYWCLSNKNESPNDKQKKHWTDRWMIILSISTGICYFVSLLLFTIFVGINLTLPHPPPTPHNHSTNQHIFINHH